jgi:hypothetical protein
LVWFCQRPEKEQNDSTRKLLGSGKEDSLRRALAATFLKRHREDAAAPRFAKPGMV